MTALANLILGLFALLPLGLLRGIGRGVGWLNLWLNTASAKVAQANIAHCYPGLSAAEQRQLCQQSLSHTAMLALEAGKVWRWPLARCLTLLKAEEGRDEFQAALAGDGGVLMLVPHLGNWEYFSPWLAEFGATALYDPPKIKALDPIVRGARERAGIRMVPINRVGLRELYGVLRGDRANEHRKLAVVLPDQVPERGAGMVEVPFFGQPAQTMTLIHRLLKKTRPQVYMGAALRVPGGFRIVVRPLVLETGADTEASVAAEMNQAIETLVVLAPEQYQWAYKRFKRTQAAAALYPKSS